MALFNYATKEIVIKIVYYGPALSGKTTNLRHLHSTLDPSKRGKLLCLSTETDRTLFFDLLPVELGRIRDFSIRFQLYTVPGQVMYNATRRLVLKGADAVVFVADSQSEMREQNIESLRNMRENLIANNINPDDTPIILQYNKRDLPNILSINELEEDLNESERYKYVESVAIEGTGVEEAFRQITKLVINDIARKQRVNIQPFDEFVRPLEFPKPPEPEYVKPPEFAKPPEFMKPPEEEIAPATAGTVEPPYEDSLITGPMIDPNTYELPDIEEYEIPQMEKEPTQTLEEESTLQKESITETAMEATLVAVEKLDMIIKSVNEISDILKELLNEIKKTAEEQREANVLLRDIGESFEKIKEKKRWFKFT